MLKAFRFLHALCCLSGGMMPSTADGVSGVDMIPECGVEVCIERERRYIALVLHILIKNFGKVEAAE